MPADYRPAPIKYAWQHQPDAVLDQAAPDQNTWYPVLASTDDVRIITFIGVIFVTGETVEGRITIDGVSIPINASAFVASTVYEACNSSPYNPDFYWVTPVISQYRAFTIEGQNIKIEIRKTTAAGAGNLFSRIKWARLLPT